jgi:hypothetical protein
MLDVDGVEERVERACVAHDWSGASRLGRIRVVSYHHQRYLTENPTIDMIARRRSAASPSERFTAAALSFAGRRPPDRRRWS